MNKVILRAINNGVIHLTYDKNLNQYTIYIFDQSNKILKSVKEIDLTQALSLLEENTDETIEPYFSVVRKSMKLGIDPSTVVN